MGIKALENKLSEYCVRRPGRSEHSDRSANTLRLTRGPRQRMLERVLGAPCMSGDRFSPVWGWALAGAAMFPALLALGYVSRGPVAVLAVGIAGAGLAAGAALAARGRGDSPAESARSWAIAGAAGVIVYFAALALPVPIQDNAVIVTPDGVRPDSDAHVIRRWGWPRSS